MTCCLKAMLPVHQFTKTLPLDLQCSAAKEGEVQSAGSPQESGYSATSDERETQLSIVHVAQNRELVTFAYIRINWGSYTHCKGSVLHMKQHEATLSPASVHLSNLAQVLFRRPRAHAKQA